MCGVYLETMQQVYSSTSKVMVDAKGQGNLLYLPLDKLMQAAGALSSSSSSVGSSAEDAGAGSFRRGCSQ